MLPPQVDKITRKTEVFSKRIWIQKVPYRYRITTTTATTTTTTTGKSPSFITTKRVTKKVLAYRRWILIQYVIDWFPQRLPEGLRTM